MGYGPLSAVCNLQSATRSKGALLPYCYKREHPLGPNKNMLDENRQPDMIFLLLKCPNIMLAEVPWECYCYVFGIYEMEYLWKGRATMQNAFSPANDFNNSSVFFCPYWTLFIIELPNFIIILFSVRDLAENILQIMLAKYFIYKSIYAYSLCI